ncbi:MAG: sugar ABC transporter permease [Treponema sp.]|nr:sugar ABC transporter permease [Treponema sp.]
MKARKRKSISQVLINQKTAPWIFVSPFIISFLVFTLYPLINTFIMSFQDIAGFDDVTFIGLKNYKNLNNEQFIHALQNSTIYTILTIIILIPLPMVLAVFINSKTTKFKNLFKSAYFLPALTSVVVAGLFFRYVFSEQETAFVNSVLMKLGAAPKKWLFQRATTMFVLVLFCTWKWVGVNMIYFLSGLNAIPQEQYEAADIDGVNSWQKFWYVTVPNLRNVTVYVVTISVYGGFAMFGETYTMFGSAASPGDIGLTMVSYIYLEGFNYARLGMGSAIGVALFAIIMIVNVIQLFATGTFKKENN